MKNYSEIECLDLFKKFFNTGNPDGTYKCVFLHSLIDISQFEKDDLIGKEWISKNEKTITVDLNFIAVRFVKSYYDIVDLNVKHTTTSKNPPNILATIKEEIPLNNFLTLADFASPGMEKFRKKVIQKSMNPEAMKSLEIDFPGMYERVAETDTIMFNSDLFDFIRSYSNYVRWNLGKKLKNHLMEINQDMQQLDLSVDPSNPFYQYLMGQRRLFLAGVQRESAVHRFKQSMETKVNLKHSDAYNMTVSVWGLRSTPDNKKVWNKIRQGDLILFAKDNRCFAKGIVRRTICNADEAVRLWGNDDKPAHDLLIIFDSVMTIHLYPTNPRTRLISPTMPNEYNFPIIQVDDGLVSRLISAYYDIESAVDNMSETNEIDVHDVSVSLVEGKTKVRRGQNIFRTKILKNYNKTCTVCSISQEDLLEASHILPVRNIEFAGDIKNGICLCVLHHKMFDRRYMYFDENYAIKFTKKSTPDLQNTCTKMKITESTCNEKPSQEYLKKSADIIKYQEM